jgi:hypothetical protein
VGGAIRAGMAWLPSQLGGSGPPLSHPRGSRGGADIRLLSDRGTTSGCCQSPNIGDEVVVAMLSLVNCKHHARNCRKIPGCSSSREMQA